jgi:hypothetical protein
MPDLKKSEVIKNLLDIMIKISGRKTNKGHAITTMESLLKQLEPRFAFLKHIQISDTRYSEDEDTVNIESDINNVKLVDMGKAINEIITTMDRTLGKSAGHFFIKEIRSTMNDEHRSIMMDIGVDLGLLQLEREVEDWERITMKKNE